MNTLKVTKREGQAPQLILNEERLKGVASFIIEQPEMGCGNQPTWFTVKLLVDSMELDLEVSADSAILQS